ncbi:hypothetical protein ABE354_08065 [Brevibacillus laterosporus]|uniref:hypothetical protein n=1 Tax=Brevibacillus laterosporus TaxID=1465 RepID=UPI003D247769
MEVMVYTINAFATDPNGGNPAGVVLEADLCGLATIAAFYLMVYQQKISHGTYTLECRPACYR